MERWKREQTEYIQWHGFASIGEYVEFKHRIVHYEEDPDLVTVGTAYGTEGTKERHRKVIQKK